MSNLLNAFSKQTLATRAERKLFFFNKLPTLTALFEILTVANYTYLSLAQLVPVDHCGEKTPAGCSLLHLEGRKMAETAVSPSRGQRYVS